MKEDQELMDGEFDVENFVEEEYTGEEHEEKQEIKEPDIEQEEKQEDSDINVDDNPILPPDFDIKKMSEEKSDKEIGDKTTEELELSEIDAAIESETNPDKKSNMARMRTKMQSQAERLAELESKINEDPKDISEYERKLEEANNKIAQLDLQEDPRFKQKYDNRIESTLREITEMVKPHFEEESEAQRTVSKLANMTPIDRNKFMIDNDVPEHYRMELSQRFREADAVWNERNQALSNFAESRKAIDLESTVDRQKQTAEVREAVFQEVTASLQKDEALLSKKPDNPEYNNFVSQRQEAARNVIESNDPKLQTKMMIQGSLMPTYKAMFELTQSQLVEAQKELARYKGSKPEFNGSSPTRTKDDSSLPGNNDDLASFIVNN